MSPPVATYRIQFRQSMDFDRAIDILPHIQALGVSHIYAAPLFTATSGSTHGYDVTDANEIDPAIGGQEGFDRFVAALKQLGLGLILDIVPNHMAASTENCWWRDVLEKGRGSVFADHFDIDWREPLTLPHLGKPFAETVRSGELTIEQGGDGRLGLRYFEALYPLSEESLSWLAEETGGNPGLLSVLARSPEMMAALHERQHWRLIPWQEAARHLSYRRFFEVTGLVGLRVEDSQVFADSHRLILDLVKRGDVAGLRIDHVDGLADPAGYLKRLRAAVGDDVFIVVEKILGAGEVLRPDWPVSGTTGYEFIEALSHLFVDKAGLQRLDGHYRSLMPEPFEDGLWRAKTEMAERNFAGEVARLTEMAADALPGMERPRIAGAIRALLAAFPVYRTYGTAQGLSADDHAVLDRAMAKAGAHYEDRAALEAVCRLLRGDAVAFRSRFQQLSGPIMAKAMEDTLFYRDNRLLATNEVGGEPNAEPGGIPAFHAAMETRLRSQPQGLSATTTHDTKRGEDARARLYAISEDADGWAAHVERWRQMNAGFVTALENGPAPDANTEWMFYQALLGILPDGIEAEILPSLRERFCAYALKAIREAKTRTDWAEPDVEYEAAVQRYAAALLSPENSAFIEDFRLASRPFLMSGYCNSLTQTLLKIAAPGIPDIYQGAEGFDLSLVDPDNRRAVDYQALAGAKQRLITRGFELRRARPALFAEGGYRPLNVTGPRADHVVAFAREKDGDYAVAVAPVRTMAALDATFWDDTRVEMPAGRKRDIIGGRRFAEGPLAVADVLSGSVALLVPE